MKTRLAKRGLLILLMLVFCTPIILWVLWYMDDKKELNVFVLDKTVLNHSYQEHLSLNWILKHNKYVKPNNDYYLPETDYFGFFPDGKGHYEIKDVNNTSSKHLIALADKYDMVYYTDLYGIYLSEWEDEYPPEKTGRKKNPRGERSKLIYGGLTFNELRFLKLMKSRKKLIINEFNIIASPTSSELRRGYEDEFHIKWSKWVGRYFENLDTTLNQELPPWLTKNYKDQNNDEWPFKKSGIVFVRNDDRIIILENETHLSHEVPIIETDNYFAEYYGVKKSIKYPFWFDICSVDTSVQIIANYSIKTNSKGDSILQKWNIPDAFPAVVTSKQDYPFYYFAGDFSDNRISMRTSIFRYISVFDFLFYETGTIERKSFFWKFYRPLVNRILDDYYVKTK